MATQSRRKSTSVSTKLFASPFRFSFFQATRLLQGLVRVWKKNGRFNPVGRDINPHQESVRFASHLSLQFASSDVVKIDKHKRIVKSNNNEIAEMKVSFLGLTGQSSILPVYFTEMQIQRLRENDTSYQDFLNIFNHRSVSFFYRAWEKYRLPFNYERVKLNKELLSDPITQGLESLVGIGGTTIKKLLPVHPEELIYYSGIFVTQRRSAEDLASVLMEYMNIPLRVNQFKGEWMPLCDEDRTQLPLFPLGGKNNCLGFDAVIGDRVFTMEGKFEIIIGPLKKSEFDDLLPNSERISALKRFTKMFVGANQHFSLKYELENEVISQWILDPERDGSRRLGWNTWLLPREISDDNQVYAVGKTQQMVTVDVAM